MDTQFMFTDQTSNKFWNIFYDNNLFSSLENDDDPDSICPVCQKSIDECESYDCEPFINAYQIFADIVAETMFTTNSYVFINMNIVHHLIHHNDDETSIYKKEMIILLKKPDEDLTFDIIKQRFNAVKNTLTELTDYCFYGRSYFFEGIQKHDVSDIKHTYDTMLSLTPEYLEHNSFYANNVSILKHFTKKFENRDQHAELSSDLYYNIIMNNGDDTNVIVYDVNWGS
jgi:hypothetical protein